MSYRYVVGLDSVRFYVFAFYTSPIKIDVVAARLGEITCLIIAPLTSKKEAILQPRLPTATRQQKEGSAGI